VTLAVVVPCLNERARLPGSVAGIREEFPDALIIATDDGSRDGTAELAETLGCQVVRLPENRGKGAAVREGVLEALQLGAEFVLFTDADLACPPEEWRRLLAPLEAGEADIAIASRHLFGSRIEGRTLSRTLASLGFAFLARTLTGLGWRDFQCGCKAFSAEAARVLFYRPLAEERYAFDVEVLLRADEAGLRVAEVPVLWRAGEASKVRLLRDGPRMLRALLRLRRIYRRSALDRLMPRREEPTLDWPSRIVIGILFALAMLAGMGGRG
jgi:glycosyltransferase involved in cell wall biosynthesis